MAATGKLTDKHKKMLRSSGWLSTRSAAFQDDLLAIGTLKTLENGQVLYARGKVPMHVYGLICGQIDVHLLAPNGEELVYPSGSQRKWYSFADVIAKEPAVGHAIARQPTKLLSISRREFLQFLNADPNRYADVIAHDNSLRRDIQQILVEIVTLDGSALIAQRLIWMIDNDRLDVNNSVATSQLEFARAVGVSVATVQRAFRDMKRRGIIDTYYGKIVVKNTEYLKRFADSLDTD